MLSKFHTANTHRTRHSAQQIPPGIPRTRFRVSGWQCRVWVCLGGSVGPRSRWQWWVWVYLGGSGGSVSVWVAVSGLCLPGWQCRVSVCLGGVLGLSWGGSGGSEWQYRVWVWVAVSSLCLTPASCWCVPWEAAGGSCCSGSQLALGSWVWPASALAILMAFHRRSRQWKICIRTFEERKSTKKVKILI